MRLGVFLTALVVVMGAAAPAAAQLAAPPGRSATREPRLATVVAREEAVVISVRSVGAAQRSLLERWQEPSPPDAFSSAGDANEMPERNLASGVIIDADGYALTNAHAVVGAAQLQVRLSGGREVAGRLVGYDLETDIALLRLEARGLPAARLGDPARLAVGDGVFAIGAPFGLESSVTAGIVSAKPRYLPGGGGLPLIQTDVAINPGSSGSPLFNLRGEVVGINSMMMSSSGGYDGVSLALPIDVVMRVAAELRDHGYVRRSRLGAQFQEVTPDLARSFGLPRHEGAVVLGVSRGGPADRAGLRTGDIVLGLAGARERSYPALQQAIAAAAQDQALGLEVWRRGEIFRIDLQPEAIERDAETAAAARADRAPEPRLGLTVDELAPGERTASRLQGGGIAVRLAAGPARDAGLRRGDVILAVNDVAITSVAAFDAALAAAVSGRPVALLVQRGGVLGYLVVQPD